MKALFYRYKLQLFISYLKKLVLNVLPLIYVNGITKCI